MNTVTYGNVRFEVLPDGCWRLLDAFAVIEELPSGWTASSFEGNVFGTPEMLALRAGGITSTGTSTGPCRGCRGL